MMKSIWCALRLSFSMCGTVRAYVWKRKRQKAILAYALHISHTSAVVLNKKSKLSWSFNRNKKKGRKKS